MHCIVMTSPFFLRQYNTRLCLFFEEKKPSAGYFPSFELDFIPLPLAAELLGLPAVGYWAFSFASGPQV